MKINVTEKSLEMEGRAPEILSGVSMIIRALKKDLPEEMIRHSIELGFKSDKEIQKQVDELLEKKAEKLLNLLKNFGAETEEE